MRKRFVLWVLAAVNAALLMSLGLHLSGENAAMGQAAGQAQVRRPADYIMIPGQVASGNLGVVYLIDTTNGVLGAMAYNDSQHQLDTMAPIDLNRVFNPVQVQPRNAVRHY
jgi:hypothetical protein